MDHLTTRQASKILGVSAQRVLALIRDGRLPAAKVGRDWLIARQDLEKFEKRPQGNYKLTAEQVREIRYMAKDGRTPVELARKFKVSVRTIYRHMNK
jgi:excisionase family DNA binding protein